VNKNDLEYFGNIILENRKNVLRSISTTNPINLEKKTHPNDSEISKDSVEMTDQGGDTFQDELDNYFVSRSIKFLRHLDQALARIEEGVYGICLICHKEIPRERLKIVPHTQHCAPCKN